MRRRLVEDREFAEAWALHLAHEVQRAKMQSEILALNGSHRGSTPGSRGKAPCRQRDNGRWWRKKSG
jgi:hypothetical protein